MAYWQHVCVQLFIVLLLCVLGDDRVARVRVEGEGSADKRQGHIAEQSQRIRAEAKTGTYTLRICLPTYLTLSIINNTQISKLLKFMMTTIFNYQFNYYILFDKAVI